MGGGANSFRPVSASLNEEITLKWMWSGLYFPSNRSYQISVFCSAQVFRKQLTNELLADVL